MRKNAPTKIEELAQNAASCAGSLLLSVFDSADEALFAWIQQHPNTSSTTEPEWTAWLWEERSKRTIELLGDKELLASISITLNEQIQDSNTAYDNDSFNENIKRSRSLDQIADTESKKKTAMLTARMQKVGKADRKSRLTQEAKACIKSMASARKEAMTLNEFIDAALNGSVQLIELEKDEGGGYLLIAVGVGEGVPVSHKTLARYWSTSSSQTKA
jgi:hypothetical protein